MDSIIDYHMGMCVFTAKFTAITIKYKKTADGLCLAKQSFECSEKDRCGHSRDCPLFEEAPDEV
jgi:hypothetical protein